MSEVKFIEVLRSYLREGITDLSHSTQKGYWEKAEHLKRLFRGYVLTWNSQTGSKIINGRAVKKYRERRLTEPNRRGGHVCANTVLGELTVACNAVNYYITELDYDIPNPFQGRAITRRERRKIQPRNRVLSAKEEKALLMALKQPYRDMIELVLENGFRRREFLELTWDRVIQVQDRDGEKVWVVSFGPEHHKGNSYDYTPLTRRALEIIISQPEVSERVFTVNGERITRDMFRYHFSKARDATGLQDVWLTDIRRTCGQKLEDNGVDIRIIQTVLRHKIIKTTEKNYVKPSIKRAADLLS